jgi:hypothetical protein
MWTNHKNRVKTGANRRLAQWRVKWLIEHSTSHQLLWCIDSFVLRNPPLPKRQNGWHTLIELSEFGYEITTKPTTDAYHGALAVELISTEGPFTILPGILSAGPILNSNFEPDFSQARVPFDHRPERVQFHYKAQPQSGDTCAFIMVLTKWNATTASADTLGMASFSTGDYDSTYRAADLSIDYVSGAMPDSIFLLFSSSLDGFNPMAGSRFIIDQLRFEGNSTGLSKVQKTKAVVYPNPANEFISIDVKNETTQLRIFDMFGKLIIHKTHYNGEKIDVSQLPKGIYILEGESYSTGISFSEKIIKY